MDRVSFRSLKGHTADGYEAALKLGLAYSAMEALQNALPPDRRLVIRDARAARTIRRLRNSTFEAFLLGSAKSPKLRSRIESMVASQSTMDILPMIEALRNTIFHGSFTPHSSDYIKSEDVRILMDLTYHLAMDEIQNTLASLTEDSLDNPSGTPRSQTNPHD